MLALGGTMQSIWASTTINAAPESVWSVLAKTSAYGEWNPFIPALEGDLATGQRLRVRLSPPGGRAMTFRPVVTVVEPHRRLEWLGRLGLPGVFDGRHTFTLEETEDGRTVLTQSEVFGGLLVPLMSRTLARTEDGFRAMNQALAARAEQSHQTPGQ
jgi:hypothetical protein